MNLIQEIMINNSIKLAYYKLSKHKQLGVQSNMNIFEVADLMDTIIKANSIKSQTSTPIFYNINAN